MQSPHRPRNLKRPSACAAVWQHLCHRCRTTRACHKIRVRRGYDMAKVLIIDDDVTLRQALTKHLEHAGHEVRQAADGNAGVRAFERRAADLVIVDIFMPGQGVKILAMSGTKSAGALDVAGHATSLGADRFITKLFEATELLELITTLLEDRTT